MRATVFVAVFLSVTAVPGHSADLKAVHPANAPKPIGPYTPGIQAGDLLYVSGQGAVTASADIATQTRETLENVKAILGAAGASMAHVVHAQVYFTNAKDYEAIEKVYAQYFPKDPPARSVIIVAALPGVTRVEVTVTAVRDLKQRNILSVSRPPITASDAVKVGERLYVSAIPGIDVPRKAAPKDARGQVKVLLERMRTVLKKGDMEIRHMAFAQVFVDRTVPLKVLREVLTEALPSETAVSVVQTEGLPRGAHIEIAGVASRSAKRAGDCASIGDTLYCGGSSGTIEQALERVNAELEAAQAGMARVVASFVFLDDIDNFAAMNKVYAGAFGEWLPTRTTVQPAVKPDELDLSPSTDAPPPVPGSPRVRISVVAVR